MISNFVFLHYTILIISCRLFPFRLFPTFSSASIQWDPSLKPLSIQAELGAAAEGSVVEVDLTSSGLRDNVAQPSKLYVRTACLELWNHLETTLHRASFVTGCPGVGKSVEVYAYVMWQAGFHKKRVLYVHSHGESYSLIATAGAAVPTDVRCGHVADFSSQPQVLLDFIVSSLKGGVVDVIVLDGQLSWLIKRVFLCLHRYPNVRLISCTSFQAITKLNTEQLANAPEFSEFLMDSWVQEEYVAAIEAGALTLDTTREHTVEEVFYYAGGSVRMIQWSVERVATCLTTKMREISDMSQLIGKQVVGDSSQSAMNTLMAIYNGCSTVISRYVLTQLIKTLSTAAILAIRRILPSNASWQGWVTELEVLLLAKERKTMIFRRPDGELEQWPRHDELRLGEPLFEFNDPCEIRDVPYDWLLPKQWNHACFDGLYRTPPDTVRAIQITIADKHSCKLKYLIPIAEAMNAHVIELVYVCRRSNFRDFKVPSPQNKPTSTSIDAAVEHQQYLDLMTALEAIRRAKKSTTMLPPSSLVIRKVCYEQVGVDPLLL